MSSFKTAVDLMQRASWECKTASFKDGLPKLMNLLKGPNTPPPWKASQTAKLQSRLCFLSGGPRPSRRRRLMVQLRGHYIHIPLSLLPFFTEWPLLFSFFLFSSSHPWFFSCSILPLHLVRFVQQASLLGGLQAAPAVQRGSERREP